MDYRFLGKTGVRVSTLALGTMTFGGEADEAASAEIFAAARDAGINLFDCANVYQQGRSEQVLGKLVANCRDQVVLTSKAYFPTGDDGNARGTSRYHLVRSVEASLRRLGTDRIDLFFLHRFDEKTALEETLRAVEHLVTSGKVLYFGVSNFSAWQTAKALGIAERFGWAPLVCTQPMYNLAKRQAEVEILPLCEAEAIGALTYSPLAGGLLTGKYLHDATASPARFRDSKMYQIRYEGADYDQLAERFARWCQEHGREPVATAIAWVASHPAVTAPLLGARTVAQLRPALLAAAQPLTPAVRAEITSLSAAPPPATDRSEERTKHTFGQR
ncbi:MAG: aldo/keto reductase [Myxococcales bacterium FL481]|nr:MAG: aldo/keto reductase [Myxococcales bacterium FL481]